MFTICWQSLRSRGLATFLTVMSLAASVALLILVSGAREAVRSGFSQAISQTDLIVGPRTGGVNLLLYSVFQVGYPEQLLSGESYSAIAADPRVQWTIPLSYGDSHKGYRVVGTTEDLFAHFRYRRDQGLAFSSGRGFATSREVVLGSTVAQRLGYKIGSEIVIAHGISDHAIEKHDDHPFVVSGILQATGTPFDRSVFVTLQGLKEMHGGGDHADEHNHDHSHAEAQAHDHDHDHHDAHEQEHHHEQSADHPADHTKVSVSALLVGLKNRMDVLTVLRDLNTRKGEALTAIMPLVAWEDLWQGLSYIEWGFIIISAMVVFTGLLGMIISLMQSVHSRRREMAIFRACGANVNFVFSLLLCESMLLTLSAAGIGWLMAGGLALLFEHYALVMGGVGLKNELFSLEAMGVVAASVILGILMGIAPAFIGYRSSLNDGLMR